MLKLAANNQNQMSENRPESRLYTKELILKLMSQGELTLHRDGPKGFIYMQDSEGHIVPIQQDLAKQIIQNPRVRQERWREGWVEAKDIGKVRWRIES
jgi:hypothetical protein